MARGFDQREQINAVFGQGAPFCGQPTERGKRAAHTGADHTSTDATGGGKNKRGKQSEHGKLPLAGKAGARRKMR
jgi:hypothetical protein